jgi:hypothetical protein
MDDATQISSPAAAAIIGLSDQAIRDHIAAGRLPAQRVGVRGLYKIQLSDLRDLAEKYNYPFDEDLANQQGK